MEYGYILTAFMESDVKLKSRILIPGWPRSRSTSAFTGVRMITDSWGQKYREWRLPHDLGRFPIHGPLPDHWTQWYRTETDFRRAMEAALEESYHRGQEEMIRHYRANLSASVQDLPALMKD
jgi:hypothetical protein